MFILFFLPGKCLLIGQLNDQLAGAPAAAAVQAMHSSIENYVCWIPVHMLQRTAG